MSGVDGVAGVPGVAGGLGRLGRLQGLWRLGGAVSVVRGSGSIIPPLPDNVGVGQPAATHLRPAKWR